MEEDIVVICSVNVDPIVNVDQIVVVENNKNKKI
jgi:hypothetical protein